jgi:methionyl-tRNA synthetase
VRRGLRDISISRAAERSGGWGIHVPDDPSQVIYVWIDALINYVSGLGFGQTGGWDEFWRDGTRTIHVIGKNVWKFHAVYWPALLLSAGLPLPDEILVHGFLTENGRKISKSRGDSVDPIECIAQFGTDSLRYYLLRAVSPFVDGDFSTERLRGTHNSDLANGLGNLVSRLATLCDKAAYGAFCAPDRAAAPGGYHDALHRFEFDTALKLLWGCIARLNQDIDRKEPWKALKAERTADLREDLTRWLGELHQIAYWLQPFLPQASGRILEIVGSGPIGRCPPLFPRV